MNTEPLALFGAHGCSSVFIRVHPCSSVFRSSLRCGTLRSRPAWPTPIARATSCSVPGRSRPPSCREDSRRGGRGFPAGSGRAGDARWLDGGRGDRARARGGAISGAGGSGAGGVGAKGRGDADAARRGSRGALPARERGCEGDAPRAGRPQAFASISKRTLIQSAPFRVTRFRRSG